MHKTLRNIKSSSKGHVYLLLIMLDSEQLFLIGHSPKFFNSVIFGKASWIDAEQFYCKELLSYIILQFTLYNLCRPLILALVVMHAFHYIYFIRGKKVTAIAT